MVGRFYLQEEETVTGRSISQSLRRSYYLVANTKNTKKVIKKIKDIG
jgi:hypothetical protein